MASDQQMALCASALTQAGFFICAGGMVAGLAELAMWSVNQYWPFATLTELIGPCTGRAVYFMALEPAPMAAGCLCRSGVDAPRDGTAPRSVRLPALAKLASPARSLGPTVQICGSIQAGIR